MTEKEIKGLAREYIDNCTERAGFVILTENIKNDFIDLFVAGFMKCLELNKEIKWHKVADGDLPKEEAEYLVIFESDGTRYTGLEIYYPDTKEWSTVCNIVVWCEIPKFEEV